MEADFIMEAKRKYKAQQLREKMDKRNAYRRKYYRENIEERRAYQREQSKIYYYKNRDALLEKNRERKRKKKMEKTEANDEIK